MEFGLVQVQEFWSSTVGRVIALGGRAGKFVSISFQCGGVMLLKSPLGPMYGISGAAARDNNLVCGFLSLFVVFRPGWTEGVVEIQQRVPNELHGVVSVVERNILNV